MKYQAALITSWNQGSLEKYQQPQNAGGITLIRESKKKKSKEAFDKDEISSIDNDVGVILL